jgi:1-acyl-sn-glycerol-3-phosphate acyltransferase
MLYTILKPLIRLALKAYFYKVNVIGRSNLLESGPVIYISNHPNAFIDPLILVILLRRELRFIAGSEWFGKGIRYWIFRSQFNMIPVIRPWLLTEGESDNADMFRECYHELSNGQCIVIYPEGSSVTVPWIRDLKTGAARIKLGAEKFDPNIKVPIVPVGLNFTRGHRFQSELIVKIGTPIDFKGIYQDPDPDNKEAVRAMTDAMQKHLKDQIVHIDQPELKPVIRNVTRLFSNTIKEDFQVAPYEVERDFNIKKEIVNAIDYFVERDENTVMEFNARIENYHRDLANIHLQDQDMMASENGTGIMEFIRLLVFFPVFFAGMAIHIIPYMFVYRYFRSVWLPKMSGDYRQGQLNPSFVGSLAFAISLLVFLIWYLIMIFLSGFFSGIWWLGVPFVVACYLSGRLSLFYLKWLGPFFQRVKVFYISRAYRKQYCMLRKIRTDLINQLIEFRDLYLDRVATT